MVVDNVEVGRRRGRVDDHLGKVGTQTDKSTKARQRLRGDVDDVPHTPQGGGGAAAELVVLVHGIVLVPEHDKLPLLSVETVVLVEEVEEEQRAGIHGECCPLHNSLANLGGRWGFRVRKYFGKLLP